MDLEYKIILQPQLLFQLILIKIKYILFYIILTFFIQCSGSGGCSFFKNELEIQKEIIKSKENNDTLDFHINKMNTEPKKMLSDNIESKKNNKSLNANLNKTKNKQKKILPKAKYVQFTNPPEPIRPITPNYPKNELNAGIQGVVYIQFKIDTLGNVSESYIAKSSSNINLDNSALNAVKSSKWVPAKNQGESVSVWQTLPFEFKLSK